MGIHRHYTLLPPLFSYTCVRIAQARSRCVCKRVIWLIQWIIIIINPVEHCWTFLANKSLGQIFLCAAELEAAIRKAWEERPRLSYQIWLNGQVVICRADGQG